MKPFDQSKIKFIGDSHVIGKIGAKNFMSLLVEKELKYIGGFTLRFMKDLIKQIPKNCDDETMFGIYQQKDSRLNHLHCKGVLVGAKKEGFQDVKFEFNELPKKLSKELEDYRKDPTPYWALNKI